MILFPLNRKKGGELRDFIASIMKHGNHAWKATILKNQFHIDTAQDIMIEQNLIKSLPQLAIIIAKLSNQTKFLETHSPPLINNQSRD